jgi:hypothetical protein
VPLGSHCCFHLRARYARVLKVAPRRPLSFHWQSFIVS